MSYKHLSYEERYYIESRLAQQDALAKIASDLKRSRSSISREIKRNTDIEFGFYSARQAQILVEQRCQATTRKPKKLSQIGKDALRFIDKSLSDRSSPEQICGRLALEFKTHISHQTIYRHVWHNRSQSGTLYEKLRRRGKKAKACVSRAAAKIANKLCISQRCEEANTKAAPGHWEIDTVFGRDQKSYLLTLVDRCSKYTVIRKLPNKEADTVCAALHDILDQTLLPFKSITSDNGSEFAAHAKLTTQHEVEYYFAHAYSSWERGLNEHTNGLIRDFLPKRTDFRLINDDEIQQIENNLNNRPRKVLSFLTPKEALVQQLANAA